MHCTYRIKLLMLCELKLQEGAGTSDQRTYETDTYYNITPDFTLGLTFQLAAISQFDDYATTTVV